jgi:hypothetical protein
VSELTTREILYRASDLLERPTSETVGLWPRATAVLARQALERGLTDVLSAKVDGIQRAPVRAQLLCLRIYLDDTATADEVNLAWWALSRACHHLSYELPPTAAELRVLIDVVDRFLEAS